MKPGDIRRFACEQCGTQYEITLEPHVDEAARRLVDTQDFTPVPVVCCPFCRGTIQEDE